MISVFRIRISLDGSSGWCIHGTEELMHEAYKNIINAMNAPDGTGEKIVEVQGITDTADRADVWYGVRIEDVKLVELCHIYGT